MTDLALAENLRIPLDAVTQTFGFIGRKGSGKTYLAGLMAEQMLDRHAQIIILDPVGNWYGLRVAADGRARGKDIFIVGGEHGDVPILPDAGQRIARLLVEKDVSVILDISSFRQGERKRFAADFAEEFFHRKKSQKSAVHLFVEEAQLFAPQRVGPDEARMLGAFENIIRLGRNYGVGASMISQRPQSINKEVLSQVECLFALQVNGTHERKALEEWVQEAGADREIVGLLPGLAQGEGYVWSPSWLRVFARFQFNKKTTFDASATPKVGQKRKAATLTPMDVEALRADMQQVIEKAEADDPAKLRAEIAKLKRMLGDAHAQTGEMLDRDALLLAQEQELGRILAANREHLQGLFGKAIGECSTAVVGVQAALTRLATIVGNQDWSPPKLGEQARQAIQAAVKPKTFFLNEQHEVKRDRPKPLTGVQTRGVPMGKAERAVLTVLAQRGSSSKAAVAAYAGYAVNGGGFNNAISKCRSNNWLTGSDPLDLTAKGFEALGSWEPLPTGAALLAHWQQKLGKAERMILSVLADAPRTPITKDELAHESAYTASGGGFNNALSRLRTLELIEGSGTIQLNKEFAEALNG